VAPAYPKISIPEESLYIYRVFFPSLCIIVYRHSSPFIFLRVGCCYMVQKEVQIGFRNHRWAPTKFLILASCHSRHVPLVTSISSPITTLSGGFWLPLYERHRFYILVNQETSSISHFNIELKCKVFKCQSWIAVSGRTTHTCYTHTVTDCEVAWWGNSPHFSREHMESDIAIHYNYPTEPKAYEPSKSDIK